MSRFEFIGRVRVIGPVATVEVRAVQPAVVLAALVLDHPRPVALDELGEAIWSDGARRDAGVIRQVVSRARRVLVAAGLPASALTSAGGVVTLDVPALDSDVTDLLEQVGNAEADLQAGHPEESLSGARAAAAVPVTGLLPGAEGPLADRWREKVGWYRQRALWTASEASVRAGRPADGATWAREALADHSLDERATRLLMAALAAGGDRAEALAAYETIRRRLDDELGVRPSPETEGLYLSILGDAPDPAAPPPPTPDAAPAPPPEGVSPFVGRARELGVADRLWQKVGHRRLEVLVIEGEAGIGKSRLATEVAARAGAAGVTVAWGRCRPFLTTPLQPFDELVESLHKGGPDLAERSEWSPGPGLEESFGPAPDDSARLRTYRAVCATVKAAADQPVLLVLDDMHWARPETVALLDQLIWTLDADPCLLVVAARRLSGPMAALAEDLTRQGRLTGLHLDGLSADEIGQLLAAGPGGPEPGGLLGTARILAERTAGNPLYVTQVIQSTPPGGSYDPHALPAGVTQLLERRVAALEPAVAAVLRLAAVAGSRFELTTLAACSATSPAALLDHLEHLCSQRLLEEVGSQRFGFVHEMVRDAVMAGLGPTRQAELHARIGRVLSVQSSEPSTVAHHLRRGSPDAVGESTEWSLASGRAALAVGAWESALEHFSAAGSTARREEERGRALIGMGRAERGLGRAAAARRTLEEALEVAESAGLGHLRAEATLALLGGGGRGVALDMPDTGRAELLSRALAGVGPDRPQLLVAVLGELALALALTDRIDERRELCDRAVRVARDRGSPADLAVALSNRRTALMGPAGTVSRLVDGLEVVRLRGVHLPIDVQIAARIGRVEDLIELGDRRGAEESMAEASALARRYQDPYWLWATGSWEALLALLGGDPERAEQLAFAARGHQPEDHPEATAALGVELVNIRLFQDRVEEMIPLLDFAAGANPHIPCYAAVLAMCQAEAGDYAAARQTFERFRPTGFRLPPDSNWLLGTTVLADCCATLGDPDAAVTLLELLEPWADRQAVLNCYGGGGAWWGPVSHHLSRLARMLGDGERADRHHREALESTRRCAAPLFESRIRREAGPVGRIGAGPGG